MGHRAGWDATFSAPKSVSLTASVGNDARVRDAHREAVRVAVNEVEKYVQARIGGNHPPETTRNWAVAKFEHDTSRPVGGYPAPQLHTHAVFFNMTKTEGGEFRAMQPREVFRSQQYGTAVYRAELSARLRSLGYDIQVERNGTPEIKGYSREYLEANSLRSQQIREHLKSAGLGGAAAAQIAAHRTREAKVSLGRDEVKSQHRDHAAKFGHEPEKVVHEARARGTRHEHDGSQHARAAITYARDKTFERDAVVDRRDLMKEALKRACGDAPLEQVKKAFDERARGGDFIRMDRQRQESASEKYTTPATIASEQRNMEFVRQGQDRFEPLVSNRVREDSTRAPHLNAGQQRSVEEILSSRDKVVGFQGTAGSGKTTALREIRVAAQREGYKVQGLAPTSRATAQLQEAGIPSSTLQRHLAEPRGRSGGRNLYVVDESSLVSTRQTREFFERMGPKDRAVLVGDSRQHQSVDAGRPFQQLQQSGMRTAKLDEIVRQRDPDLKRVVGELADGRVREAMADLQKQGRVHEIPDRQERFEAIARDYANTSSRTLVVSPDNQSRRELNDHIREELKSRGVVSREDHKAPVLVPRQDMTGADRAWGGRYQEGDVIRYTKGSRELGIKPGEYATVREVDARQNTLKVDFDGRSQAQYDPRRLRGVAVYEKSERNFSEGDRVQLTAPNRSAGLANRELGKIERIDTSGNMHLRMDSGRTAVTRPGERLHLDHGYAVTSHSAQGATADRVMVHAESGQSAALVNQRFAYVAGSRMREGLDVYTDNTQKLASSLHRKFDKIAALSDRASGRPQHGQQMGNHSARGPSSEAGQAVGAGQSPQRASPAHGTGHGL